MLRYLHILDEHPRLVISIRNDEGAPQEPERRVGYGTTEWRDVEASVRYALDHGASNVILYGISMGGAITIASLIESDLVAERTIGVILESPAADVAEIVRVGSRRMGAPDVVANAAMWAAERRFGIDFSSMDYVQRLTRNPAKLRIPGLILAGDDDQAVPLSIVERLAGTRENLELVVLPDVGHVRGWNVMADEYEKLVGDFVTELKKGP